MLCLTRCTGDAHILVVGTITGHGCVTVQDTGLIASALDTSQYYLTRTSTHHSEVSSCTNVANIKYEQSKLKMQTPIVDSIHNEIKDA